MVAPFNKIYIITLKRAVARQRKYVRHMESLGGLVDKNGNPPEIVFGSTGSEISHQVDNSIKLKNRLSPVSQGEIGCYASHRTVYQKFIQSQLETCLILEDDFRFESLAKEVFQNWDQMPAWDYVNFGFCTNQKSIVSTLKLAEERPWKNLYQGSGMWLTHAYAINQNAAQLFLEGTEIQQGGIDWQLTGIQYKLKSYGFTNPSIIRQEKVSMSNPSFIRHTQ
jgi:glycosyl transferase family 25